MSLKAKLLMKSKTSFSEKKTLMQEIYWKVFNQFTALSTSSDFLFINFKRNIILMI